MPFLANLWAGILAVIKSPFQDVNTIWVLGPILLLWVTLVIYFDKYKREKLGWNTALGNGISMFWISVMLMRHIFEDGFSWPVFISLSTIVLYSLFIAIISFKHSVDEDIAFTLASPTPIYFFSAAAVVVAYGALELNLYTILGLAIVFGIILALNRLLSAMIPEAQKVNKKEVHNANLKRQYIARRQNFRQVPNNTPIQGFQGRAPNQPMNLENVRI